MILSRLLLAQDPKLSQEKASIGKRRSASLVQSDLPELLEDQKPEHWWSTCVLLTSMFVKGAVGGICESTNTPVPNNLAQ